MKEKKTLTIKQKVKISNIGMVLIPIIFTAIVIAVCVNTSLGSHWYTLEAMYSDENGIQFAQSMIYTYQQELWENNWGQEQVPSIEDVDKEITQTDEMYHLEHKLSGMGYHFMVTKNGKLLYSNISDEEMEIARSVAGDGVDTAKMLTASRYEVSVIKNTFYHDDKIFCITAVHPQAVDSEVVDYLKNYILKYVFGIIAFFVMLSVGVNGFMSWWISKSIFNPLQKLSMGTKEIREGNLEKTIDYTKMDEFGDVCLDFDEMRVYLKESVEQRLQDESRRKELITGISHDLRTPLTSISGYLDGLIDGIADTPEKRMRYYQAMKTRTGDLISLAEALSEYCRLDSTHFHYNLEIADARQYIEHYLETYRADMEENEVKVTFVCEAEQYSVHLDKQEMKRVFDNLFTNTIRYREDLRSNLNITLNHNSDKDVTEIGFEDNGPGVPEESLKKVFDSFYRVDHSRIEVGKGSGIGLAVVKEIIRGHGGTVRAENRKGLAIIIELPTKKE